MGEIVALYNTLMTIRPSPIIALNRAIAMAQRDGPERGLEAIGAIEGRDRLATYPFYSAARGELELRRGRRDTAREHFRAALVLARNPMERRYLDRRINACDGGDADQLGYYEEFWNERLIGLEGHLDAPEELR